MILLQETQRSPLAPCHYISSETWRFDYFFASDLSARELDSYLLRGWRKFGYYYFRPSCPSCEKCVPLRIRVSDFKPSRSQKRVMSRNKDLRVRFGPLSYNDRIFEIYCDHSRVRFGNDSHDISDFFTSFYSPSCPVVQSEYYMGDTLVGVGYLDVSRQSLSSVYFIFDTAFSHLNLGTFSILTEIEEARVRGLPYYYLGYYIEDCGKMAYKNRFLPNEHYNWQTCVWETNGR